eukprot:8052910-Pyramimonas_sp.AAC.1
MEQSVDAPTCKTRKKLQREEERARAAEARVRVCSECGVSKSRADFSAYMLARASNASVECTECVNAAAALRNKAARKDMKTCV